MLVVIGIIAVLLTMLVPMLGPALEKARQTRCGSNLSECFKIVLQYANDNSGRLPPAHADDPTQLVASQSNGIPRYVETLKLQGSMWYCPSLIRQRPTDRNIGKWVYPVRSNASGSPFNIGYCYVGAPVGDTTKFLVPYPGTSADLNNSVAIMADICSAQATDPTGKTVAKGRWTIFPHAGVNREQICKTCMGDGSVASRPKDVIVRSFAGASGSLYW
jgi:type II secretory pathway pseudopilin PulG